MIAITVKDKFWDSPTRVVYHNTETNRIHTKNFDFSWANFFEVNEIVK